MYFIKKYIINRRAERAEIFFSVLSMKSVEKQARGARLEKNPSMYFCRRKILEISANSW